MANLQERLQVSRVPLDKWSIREQLCLTSAVSCSGDQNWMTVSRTLKVICGNSKNLQSRPSDWFSQKNCAVQYGYLLQDVDTPKHKKHSSESSVSPSASSVDRSTEAHKRLIEERISEIKIKLRKQQEEYSKLYNEIKFLQNGEVSEDQLMQVWKELEKDHEMQRIEEMKLENQLRERELRKQELQRTWRTGTSTHSTSSSMNSIKSSTDTTAVDMDVEEIIGTGKTIITANSINIGQMQTGTSPLLSSLLKSPNAGSTTTNIVATAPSVRNTAPTITTLLTGGSIPNQNQPALIPSHNEAVQILTRPISGPPLDTVTTTTSAAQNLLSPSQSAPTLSMLLEKNKTCVPNAIETKTSGIICTDTKVIQNTNVDDCNNESVPMDIEEGLSETKLVSNNDVQSADIDETDPNEEQQLLEVFKNIGNIEELDIDVSDVIDEEVDFLKGVDEEVPLDENIDIEQKLETNFSDLNKNITHLTNETTKTLLNSKNVEQPLSKEPNEDIKLENEGNKVEIISSDDSNDNIPLAAVASLECKDRPNMNESSNEDIFLKDQVESANFKKEQDQAVKSNESGNNSVTIKQEIFDENVKLEPELAEADNESNKEPDNSERKDDVFVTPSIEEIKQENVLKLEKEEINDEKQQHIVIETKDDNDMNDSSSCAEADCNNQKISNKVVPDSSHDVIEIIAVPKIQPPPSISIADTDENSSSTDISVQTRKDDKVSNRGLRKSPHETKGDDENSNSTTPQITTPIASSVNVKLEPRPTALRKLRDRDRSESPMIDDEATTHSDHSTTNQRSRRRYSSTPIIDSIPNSPASSDRDEKDLRTSKKSLLSIYNVLYTSKYSSTIQRVFNCESSAQRLNEICLRSIDFFTIKKNIESGLIRSIYELQRDVLLMCQNALMITKSTSAIFKTILQFQQECQNIKDFISNGCEPSLKLDNKFNSSTSSSSKGRSGSRKSLRLS